jgi:superfamily II DNA or RNA helicase
MEPKAYALTRKVAVIQGPPGTGKTFPGLKIVQVLLKNSQFWRPAQHQQSAGKPKAKKPSPILVICYTNHALDQFLEGTR